MENLKIKVNSGTESREAQELFFELGYGFDGCKIKTIQHLEYTSDYYFFAYSHDMDLTHSFDYGVFINKAHKEITLPQLRDLVVLKRNNATDCTHWHVTGRANSPYLFAMDEWYFFGRNGWEKSTHTHEFYNRLKPIEKPMKEYLRKNSNGTYSYIGTVRHEYVSDFMIEIPGGSNIAVIEDSKVKFYSKYTSADLDHLGKDLIWMRPSQPEELPFIDDEITDCREAIQEIYKPSDFGASSLNDQYAEIEKVRQSAWQKQEDGSHYKNLKIQPMQYALENKLDYAQANVVKYVTRHKEKNGKEDLLKAIHNIELMIEFYYGDEK